MSRTRPRVTEAGWERVADNVGGTVGGLARSGSVVFAATAVGVHISLDAGLRWTPAGIRDTLPFVDVIAPSARFAQDRTIFAGAGDGLYRSSDGGESWQPVLVGSRMLGVSTADEGAAGLVLAATETDGVLRSEDGGASWTGVNAGLLDLTVLTLALSPQFGADRTAFAGTQSGLYRTRNGARSWRQVDLQAAQPAVQCLAISPNFSDDRLVLAGTEADGLLRSDDAGATWHQPSSLIHQGITAVAFSGSKPTVAAATESGIAVSNDGGKTWRLAGSPPGVVLSLIFVPTRDGEVLLAGLHQRGVARSSDDGARWHAASEGLSARLLTGLVLSPAFAQDRTLFVAGPQDGVYVSNDGGRTWTDCTVAVDDPEVLSLAMSPAYAVDRTLYAATTAGVHVSHDAARTWAQPSTTLRASFDGAEILALALSPAYAQDRTIFVATRQPGPGESTPVVLWRSVDGGACWEIWLETREVAPASHAFMALAVSPSYANDQVVFAGIGPRISKPLSNFAPRPRVWQDARLGPGVVAVTAFAPSPAYAEDKTIFAATNAGVFVSRDGGDTYHHWSDGPVSPGTVALAVSPAYGNDRLVYALGLGGTVWRRHGARPKA